MKIIIETKNAKEYRRQQLDLTTNLYTTEADALPCAVASSCASLVFKIRMCHQTAFYPWLQCLAGVLWGSTIDRAQLQTYLPSFGP